MYVYIKQHGIPVSYSLVPPHHASLPSPWYQLRLLTTAWGGDGRLAGIWDFLNEIFGNCVFLLFISLFLIPPPSSCHSLAVKMKSCHLCAYNNGGLCRPHGSCSLIYFNSFYIEPNDLICLFLMESLQHAGWEPSPLSKEIMSPAAIKTCTQLDVPLAAPGEEGTPLATGTILLPLTAEV